MLAHPLPTMPSYGENQTDVDDIRTARAIRYKRVSTRPVVTTKGESEASVSIMEMAHTPRRRSPADRLQAAGRVGASDNDPCFTPYKQHGDPTACPPTIDRYSVDETRPWTPQQPICVPATFPEWPSPRSPDSSSPSPTSRSPSPAPWTRWRRRAHPPCARFKRLDLRPKAGSTVLNETCKPAQFSRPPQKKSESSKFHEVPPVLEPATEPKGDRIVGELPTREIVRMQEQARQRRLREGKSDSPLEVFSDLVKDILRRSKPQVIFDEDFGFGPRKKKWEGDDQQPLSPRSTRTTRFFSSPAIQQRSPKRQRHDSSNGDTTIMSPRDRLHSTSSPIPIQQRRPTLLAAEKPFSRGFGTPHFSEFTAHPGNPVDYTLSSLPKVNRETEARKRQITSDYNLNHVVASFESCQNHAIHDPVGHHILTSPIQQPSVPGQRLKGQLEPVFSRQGGLNDKAQEAVDESTRVKTCGLQRKARTTRDHAPICDDNAIGRTTTAESSASMKGQPLTPTTTPLQVDTMASSGIAPDGRLRKKRSWVARCSSSDKFLRTIRDSRESRDARILRMHDGRRRSDTPDPRSPNDDADDEDDWLGKEPL